MNDAPEKIWAWYFLYEKQNAVMKGGWDNVKDHACTEYTRTDIAQARIDELEGFIAKAFEAHSNLDLDIEALDTTNE
jgi:hypothetical protein